MEAAWMDVQKDTKEGTAKNHVHMDILGWTVCTHAIPTVVVMDPVATLPEFAMKVARMDGVAPNVEHV